MRILFGFQLVVVTPRPDTLSLLLRACTCAGEDHPGPSTSTGRGAPEIDIFEAQINKDTYTSGRVTQSAQMAPFNLLYYAANSTTDQDVYDTTVTKLNTYRYVALQCLNYGFVTFSLTDSFSPLYQWLGAVSPIVRLDREWPTN